MKYWKLPKYIVLLITLSIIILVVVALSYSSSDIIKDINTVTALNDNWTIELDGRVLENVDITVADIGVIDELDTVVISRKLEDAGLDNPCLTFSTIHAVTDVYLDDELIYTFAHDYYDKKNSVPKKHHHISLGNYYQGKTLTIKLMGGRKAAFSGLSSVYLGARSDILAKEFLDSMVPLTTGLFLFTLGIMLIVLSPYLFVFHNHDLRIFFSGLTSLVLAIYIMGFNGIFDIFINNSMLNTIFEFSTLYNIPTVVLGYLMSSFAGRIKKIFTGLFIFDVFLFLSSIVLHFTKIARFADFTVVLHVVAASECIFSIFVIIRHYLAQKNEGPTHAYSSDNVFMAGLITFMLLSILDIVRYNLHKYTPGSGEAHIALTGFTFGALVYVTSLLLSYFYYNINSTNMNTMQSKIKSIAYTDALTGLSNRARCEQMMTMLSKERGTFAIISLDLNKLKQVNDTLGHHEGDRLITGFSTILSETFWDANLIGRMGGDEFMVILLEDRTLNLTKRIHEFYSLINEWNNKEQVFKYSASYGYAYSYEVPNGSAKEVYMLADNRMYEMKREQHDHEDKEVMINA